MANLADKLDDATRETLLDVGLLIMRVPAGLLMALCHGYPKLMSWSAKSASFPDPLGVGSAASLALAIFGELVCGVLVAAGVATRAAAVPVVITMLVAAFVIHGDDPFKKKEFALVYAIPFLALVFTGPGRFSVDARLFPRGAGK